MLLRLTLLHPRRTAQVTPGDMALPIVLVEPAMVFVAAVGTAAVPSLALVGMEFVLIIMTDLLGTCYRVERFVSGFIFILFAELGEKQFLMFLR